MKSAFFKIIKAQILQNNSLEEISALIGNVLKNPDNTSLVRIFQLIPFENLTVHNEEELRTLYGHVDSLQKENNLSLFESAYHSLLRFTQSFFHKEIMTLDSEGYKFFGFLYALYYFQSFDKANELDDMSIDHLGEHFILMLSLTNNQNSRFYTTRIHEYFVLTLLRSKTPEDERIAHKYIELNKKSEKAKTNIIDTYKTNDDNENIPEVSSNDVESALVLFNSHLENQNKLLIELVKITLDEFKKNKSEKLLTLYLIALLKETFKIVLDSNDSQKSKKLSAINFILNYLQTIPIAYLLMANSNIFHLDDDFISQMSERLQQQLKDIGFTSKTKFYPTAHINSPYSMIVLIAAYNGASELIKEEYLINRLDFADENNQTCLHIALQQEWFSFANMALTFNPSLADIPYNKSGQSLLPIELTTFIHDERFFSLLENKINTEVVTKNRLIEIILQAIGNKNLMLLNLLEEAGFIPDALYEDVWNAIVTKYLEYNQDHDGNNIEPVEIISHLMIFNLYSLFIRFSTNSPFKDEARILKEEDLFRLKLKAFELDSITHYERVSKIAIKRKIELAQPQKEKNIFTRFISSFNDKKATPDLNSHEEDSFVLPEISEPLEVLSKLDGIYSPLVIAVLQKSKRMTAYWLKKEGNLSLHGFNKKYNTWECQGAYIELQQIFIKNLIELIPYCEGLESLNLTCFHGIIFEENNWENLLVNLSKLSTFKALDVYEGFLLDTKNKHIKLFYDIYFMELSAPIINSSLTHQGLSFVESSEKLSAYSNEFNALIVDFFKSSTVVNEKNLFSLSSFYTLFSRFEFFYLRDNVVIRPLKLLYNRTHIFCNSSDNLLNNNYKELCTQVNNLIYDEFTHDFKEQIYHAFGHLYLNAFQKSNPSLHKFKDKVNEENFISIGRECVSLLEKENGLSHMHFIIFFGKLIAAQAIKEFVNNNNISDALYSKIYAGDLEEFLEKYSYQTKKLWNSLPENREDKNLLVNENIESVTQQLDINDPFVSALQETHLRNTKLPTNKEFIELDIQQSQFSEEIAFILDNYFIEYNACKNSLQNTHVVALNYLKRINATIIGYIKNNALSTGISEKEFNHDVRFFHLASRILSVVLNHAFLKNLEEASSISDINEFIEWSFLIKHMQSNIGLVLQSLSQSSAKDIHWAAASGNIALLKTYLNDSNVDESITETLESPILLAAHTGNIAMVEELYKSGANFTLKDRSDRSILHVNSFHGHVLLFKKLMKLLEEKHELFKPQDLYESLIVAIRNNQMSIIIKLDMQVPNLFTYHHNTGVTPLMIAAEEGHKKLVKYLVKKKNFKINDKDPKGETALFYAARNRQKNIVDFLIQLGADTEVKNNLSPPQTYHEVEGLTNDANTRSNFVPKTSLWDRVSKSLLRSFLTGAPIRTFVPQAIKDLRNTYDSHERIIYRALGNGEVSEAEKLSETVEHTTLGIIASISSSSSSSHDLRSQNDSSQEYSWSEPLKEAIKFDKLNSARDIIKRTNNSRKTILKAFEFAIEFGKSSVINQLLESYSKEIKEKSFIRLLKSSLANHTIFNSLLDYYVIQYKELSFLQSSGIFSIALQYGFINAIEKLMALDDQISHYKLTPEDFKNFINILSELKNLESINFIGIEDKLFIENFDMIFASITTLEKTNGISLPNLSDRDHWYREIFMSLYRRKPNLNIAFEDHKEKYSVGHFITYCPLEVLSPEIIISYLDLIIDNSLSLKSAHYALYEFLFHVKNESDIKIVTGYKFSSHVLNILLPIVTTIGNISAIDFLLLQDANPCFEREGHVSAVEIAKDKSKILALLTFNSKLQEINHIDNISDTRKFFNDSFNKGIISNILKNPSIALEKMFLRYSFENLNLSSIISGISKEISLEFASVRKFLSIAIYYHFNEVFFEGNTIHRGITHRLGGLYFQMMNTSEKFNESEVSLYFRFLLHDIKIAQTQAQLSPYINVLYSLFYNFNKAIFSLYSLEIGPIQDTFYNDKNYLVFMPPENLMNFNKKLASLSLSDPDYEKANQSENPLLYFLFLAVNQGINLPIRHSEIANIKNALPSDYKFFTISNGLEMTAWLKGFRITIFKQLFDDEFKFRHDNVFNGSLALKSSVSSSSSEYSSDSDGPFFDVSFDNENILDTSSSVSMNDIYTFCQRNELSVIDFYEVIYAFYFRAALSIIFRSNPEKLKYLTNDSFALINTTARECMNSIQTSESTSVACDIKRTMNLSNTYHPNNNNFIDPMINDTEFDFLDFLVKEKRFSLEELIWKSFELNDISSFRYLSLKISKTTLESSIKNGRTLIMVAILLNDIESFNNLMAKLEYSAEDILDTIPEEYTSILDKQDKNGETALMYAYRSFHKVAKHFVRELMLAGCNTQLTNLQEETAFDIANIVPNAPLFEESYYTTPDDSDSALSDAVEDIEENEKPPYSPGHFGYLPSSSPSSSSSRGTPHKLKQSPTLTDSNKDSFDTALGSTPVNISKQVASLRKKKLLSMKTPTYDEEQNTDTETTTVAQQNNSAMINNYGEYCFSDEEENSEKEVKHYRSPKRK